MIDIEIDNNEIYDAWASCFWSGPPGPGQVAEARQVILYLKVQAGPRLHP